MIIRSSNGCQLSSPKSTNAMHCSQSYANHTVERQFFMPKVDRVTWVLCTKKVGVYDPSVQATPILNAFSVHACITVNPKVAGEGGVMGYNGSAAGQAYKCTANTRDDPEHNPMQNRVFLYITSNFMNNDKTGLPWYISMDELLAGSPSFPNK